MTDRQMDKVHVEITRKALAPIIFTILRLVHCMFRLHSMYLVSP